MTNLIFKQEKKLGNYATEVRRLSINVIGAIMESLDLSANYLRDKVEQGNQMIVAKNYPQSSSSANTMGQQCHADHSIVTFLAENTTGALEIMNFEDNTNWMVVSAMEGTFIITVGNHLEVISTGLYKTVFHGVARSSQSHRVSIAS